MSNEIMIFDFFPDFAHDAWALLDDYLRDLFPMQKTGMLMMPQSSIGAQTGYDLSPSNVMEKFYLVYGCEFQLADEEGNSSDANAAIFLFPTKIGILTVRVGIGIGNNWAFINMGDVVTWYHLNVECTKFFPFVTQFNEGKF